MEKYNEEVIEMNKKHDIVSSIFNLGKKGEILLKPSLCLKKILPHELQNIDERVEKGKTTEKIKKRNKHKKIRITFDFTFINIILTLITLLIILAFYKTGRKLLINAGQHKE